MNNAQDSIRTLEFQDYHLCYRDVGKGPIIILIHGWSLDSAYWDPHIDFLSKNYRVIAYDSRGTGCSGGGRRAYTFQDLCDEARAVIRALCGGEKPILIGHSLGGNISLQLAIESSDRLSSLIVVDAPLPHRVKETIQLILFKFITDRLSLKLMAAYFERPFWGEKFPATHPETIEAWHAQFISNSQPALINSMAAWVKRPNPIPNLNKIKLKSLLVAGEEDSIAGEDMQTLHQAFAAAQYVTIKNASHMSFAERPDEFNKIVASFLDSLRAA
jgi:3-oxoadipate enol-lactonase